MGGVSAIQKFELMEQRARADQQLLNYVQNAQLPPGVTPQQAFLIIRQYQDAQARQALEQRLREQGLLQGGQQQNPATPPANNPAPNSSATTDSFTPSVPSTEGNVDALRNAARTRPPANNPPAR